MKRVMLFLTVVAILVLAACSAKPEPTVTPVPVVSVTTAAPEPTPASTPASTPEPAALSKTTGLPYEGDYKPVMIVIENSPAARPQLGLQTADIVYEVPVEGSITRFVCVFSDNVPEEVMPVRSARMPFLYIQHEWDAIFMHFGGSKGDSDTNVYNSDLYDDINIVLDGLGKGHDYYYRTSDKSAPHNVKGKVQEAQKLYDYEPKPLAWLFDSEVTYAGDTANEISLSMCSGKDDFVSYVYSPEADVYLRSMQGKPFLSAETGEQVSVKNVIVQYSTYKSASQGRKLWKLVGEGNADFYIGGKLVNGRWERSSEDEPTMFFDGNGKQIVLRPGNTWVHISPEK